MASCGLVHGTLCFIPAGTSLRNILEDLKCSNPTGLVSRKHPSVIAYPRLSHKLTVILTSVLDIHAENIVLVKHSTIQQRGLHSMILREGLLPQLCALHKAIRTRRNRLHCCVEIKQYWNLLWPSHTIPTILRVRKEGSIRQGLQHRAQRCLRYYFEAQGHVLPLSDFHLMSHWTCME